eukprot:s562_g16.t1
MAADPNRWFDLWDTFVSILRSDGAATTEQRLLTLQMGELEGLCDAADLPVPRLSGKAKKEKMAESSSSSGPPRSTQQSSQPLEDEAVIFESGARLDEELKNKSKEAMQDLCARVVRARGDHWMRQALNQTDRALVLRLAGKVGIQVAARKSKKTKEPSIDEFTVRFTAVTGAWFCIGFLFVFDASLLLQACAGRALK